MYESFMRIVKQSYTTCYALQQIIPKYSIKNFVSIMTHNLVKGVNEGQTINYHIAV